MLLSNTLRKVIRHAIPVVFEITTNTVVKKTIKSNGRKSNMNRSCSSNCYHPRNSTGGLDHRTLKGIDRTPAQKRADLRRRKNPRQGSYNITAVGGRDHRNNIGTDRSFAQRTSDASRRKTSRKR